MGVSDGACGWEVFFLGGYLLDGFADLVGGEVLEECPPASHDVGAVGFVEVAVVHAVGFADDFFEFLFCHVAFHHRVDKKHLSFRFV